MNEGKILLEARDVEIAYKIGDFRDIGLKEWFTRKLTHNYRVEKFKAVDGVSFTLERGELLGIVGTDEQIQRLLPIVEDAPGSDIAGDDIEMKLMPIEVKDGSLLVGKTAASVRLRDDYQALLVAIQRGEDDYIKPDGSETFEPHDTLWVVGNETKLAALCQ